MSGQSFLLIANYNSGVGYAWWLMEGFWCELAQEFCADERVVVAYPSIDTVPAAIREAKLELVEVDFSAASFVSLWQQTLTIRQLGVRSLYLTDRASVSLLYAWYRLIGVRSIIVHDHTPGRRTPPVGWKRLLKRMLSAVPVLRASGMIGATPFVTARHREVNLFPAQRCFTATNGLPERSPVIPIEVRGAFGIEPQRVVIVGVGRVSPIKGIDIVLEAISLLVHDDGLSGIHYLHLGDGPAMDALRDRANELRIAPWVTFAGKVPDVRPYLPSCDIAIHASRGEVGYSLAILEFMQAGLPAVVSDDPSVSGATDDGVTGLLFRPGEARSAADALKRLIADANLRKHCGEQALRVQVERFTLRETHRMLIAAVRRIRELDHNDVATASN